MKKILIIGMLTSLAACSGGNDSASSPSLLSGPVVVAENGVTTNVTQSPMTVNDLLIAAYQDGQAEIQLSQLALQVSTNSGVTEFAQRMIADHALLNNEIMRLAGLRNVSLPSTITADQQATLTRLQGLSGAEFDRAYMDVNAAVHEKDAAQLRLQARQATDSDIQRLVAVAYPLIKQHLVRAEEINGLLTPSAFLISAYRDGLQEIQLSQLALQKATRDDVKAFAQRMISDHTSLNNQITQVAQRMGVTLPTALSQLQQVELTDLGNCMGVDCDKAYMDFNVIAHAKDVSVARLVSEQSGDQAVALLAQSALPILTQHYQQAVDLDNAIQPSLLYSVAQNSLANLQQAGLAVLRVPNGATNNFAQRVINDVNNIRSQLTTLAQQRNVQIPVEVSPNQATAFSGLAALPSVSFEQGYRSASIASLRQQIDSLGSQNNQSNDTGLQAFVASVLQTLQSELTAAQSIVVPRDGS